MVFVTCLRQECVRVGFLERDEGERESERIWSDKEVRRR